MRGGKSSVLIAPLLFNSSCWHPRVYSNGLAYRITVSGVTESALVSLLTIAILIANLIVIITINSSKYTKFIHPQVNGILWYRWHLFSPVINLSIFLASLSGHIFGLQRSRHWTTCYTSGCFFIFSQLLAILGNYMSDTSKYIHIASSYILC